MGDLRTEAPAGRPRRPRLIRWFRRRGLLDSDAAADMLTWENSGFSIDASIRVALVDRDVPSYLKSPEHLLRYCARPAFALERFSLPPGRDASPERIRYGLPRHKRGQWVGLGRKRKTAGPGQHGVIDLSPFEFLNRLADLVPPPRKHWHRYHGVFAPNHSLQPAVKGRRPVGTSWFNSMTNATRSTRPLTTCR